MALKLRILGSDSLAMHILIFWNICRALWTRYNGSLRLILILRCSRFPRIALVFFWKFTPLPSFFFLLFFFLFPLSPPLECKRWRSCTSIRFDEITRVMALHFIPSNFHAHFEFDGQP